MCARAVLWLAIGGVASSVAALWAHVACAPLVYRAGIAPRNDALWLSLAPRDRATGSGVAGRVALEPPDWFHHARSWSKGYWQISRDVRPAGTPPFSEYVMSVFECGFPARSFRGSSIVAMLPRKLSERRALVHADVEWLAWQRGPYQSRDLSLPVGPLWDGIAVNSLWPLTAIDTAAVRNLLGGATVAAMSRSPEILADAAYAIFNRPARETTGNFFIDEDVLRAEGISDFSVYAPHANGPLAGDFFVPDEAFDRSPTKVTKAFG